MKPVISSTKFFFMNLWSTPLSVPNLRKRQRLLGAPYRAQPHNHERNQIIHFFSTFPNYQIPKLSKNLNFQQPNFDKKPEISSPPPPQIKHFNRKFNYQNGPKSTKPSGKNVQKNRKWVSKIPISVLDEAVSQNGGREQQQTNNFICQRANYANEQPRKIHRHN